LTQFLLEQSGKAMQSLNPEFFLLLGIDFFLATSLLTCVLERSFPDKLAYLYQLLGLAGFGQLLVSREFLSSFPPYMRFWYSFIYLAVAVVSIASLNFYLLYKKAKTLAKGFLVVATAPAFVISSMFIYNYSATATHPLVTIPMITLDFIFLAVVAFDTLIISVGIYALTKPKWWQLTAPATALMMGAAIFASFKPSMGEPTFLAGAIYIYIFLGIACFGVLGASLLVLLRLWRDKQLWKRR